MKLFQKNEKKATQKLPMTGKVKKGFRHYCVAVLAVMMVFGTSMTAFAANDPIAVVNNLSNFIFGLIRAVGMIMLGFGIVQVGSVKLVQHYPKITPVIFPSLSTFISLITERQRVRFSSRVNVS